MNIADWILLAILLVSSLIGLYRGLVKEVLSLIVWIAALLIALLFQDNMAAVLQPMIDSASLRAILAFVLLLIATLIVGTLCIKLFEALVQASGLSGLNRLLGMLFGLGRGVVLIVALIIVIPLTTSMQQTHWWQGSQLMPYFVDIEHYLQQKVARYEDDTTS